MPEPIRVLYASSEVDQELVDLLSEDPDFAPVGCAATCDEILASYETSEPEIVLLDETFSGRGMTEVIEAIRYRNSKTKILALSASDDANYIRTLLNSGASGYLLKQVKPVDVLLSIRAIHSGTIVVSPDVIRNLLQHIRGA